MKQNLVVIVIILVKMSIVWCIDDGRLQVLESNSVTPADIKHTNNDYIHVAMILTNVLGKTKKIQNNITVEFQKYDEKKSKLLVEFEKMLESIFLYSSGVPLHLILLTDEESEPVIHQVIINAIGKYLSETVIRITYNVERDRQLQFPKLKVEFVDISSITRKYSEDIDNLRQYYGHHAPPGTVFKPQGEDGPAFVPTWKYTLDLFYILPFYHLEFPESLHKLIFLDTDLILQTDLIWLYKHFKKFSPTNLFGVASDQTPHYFDKSREFRKQNPDSKVGSLGMMQGLNTGVTLLDLQRMRSSKVYRYLTQIDEMIKLEKKYNIKGTVGDQDWLTLLSWEMEDLFYLLPCEFNRQTDMLYNNDGWREIFEKYHQCDKTARIIHHNGEGSP